jgi:hypothetical protein
MDKIHNKRWFIIEDIHFYKGIAMRKMNILERILCIEKCMKMTERNHKTPEDLILMIPCIWNTKKMEKTIAKIPDNIYCYIPYNIHHIQFRSSKEFKPFINMMMNNKIIDDSREPKPEKKENNTPINIISKTEFPTIREPFDPTKRSFVMDFSKPQYKYNTVFQIKADIQYDIYNLYAYGKNKTPILYNIAYVPNYKSSVYLNGLFRNIRENKNLDYIEESDDEEDFENIQQDKYVDLNKILLMECVFNNKFKKWIPIKVVDKNSKVVHISSLVKFN